MHIPPHDNQNRAIVDVGHPLVPLTYFNIVRLKRGERFDYAVPGYETCIVPATGTIRVDVGGQSHADLGGRGADVWDGEPEAVYVPTGMVARLTGQSDSAEVFIAGARFDRVLEPFVQIESVMSRRHQGAGLGLALVKSMTDLHGGDFFMDSQPGHGTVATIRLDSTASRPTSRCPTANPSK